MRPLVILENLVKGLDMSKIRDSFQQDLAAVAWRELRIHLQRDAIIVVGPSLDLIDTAVAVADDDTNRVQEWMTDGLIGKPEKEQLEVWEADLDRSFQMLIVQPYILIQSVNSA